MNKDTSHPDFSIVIPVYFNEGLLAGTFAEIRRDVLEADPDRHGEVVFVDDGSRDRSLTELLAIRDQYPDQVKVVALTRNFGQVSAIRAGMAEAQGRCVIVISADGQDPAALMNTMLHAHFQEGCEVVVAAREGRDESVYRIATSKLFYRLMRKLTFSNMPSGGFDYVLLGRRAVNQMQRSREASPFFQGQILWMGFSMKIIGYRRRERKTGRSRWSFGRKLTYLIDGLTSYSFLPLRLVSLLGLITAGLGFVYALIIVLIRLVYGLPSVGWAPLMITILLLGGAQLITLGVFGEYLWRVLAQVQNREPYLIDRIYDRQSPEGRHPAQE